MAFVYQENATFTRTVKVNVPVDGGFEQQSFKVRFRVFDADKIDSYDRADPVQSTKFLKDVIDGLDDIVGGDKKPIPYSEKLRDFVVMKPYARQPLHDAYFEGVRGVAAGN